MAHAGSALRVAHCIDSDGAKPTPTPIVLSSGSTATADALGSGPVTVTIVTAAPRVDALDGRAASPRRS